MAENERNESAARPLDDRELSQASGGAACGRRFAAAFTCPKGHTWQSEYPKQGWYTEECRICGERASAGAYPL